MVVGWQRDSFRGNFQWCGFLIFVDLYVISALDTLRNCGTMDRRRTKTIAWEKRTEQEVSVEPPNIARDSRPARTALGKRLLEIRQRIVASGQPLLDWEAFDREMKERRGSRNQEDDA